MVGSCGIIFDSIISIPQHLGRFVPNPQQKCQLYVVVEASRGLGDCDCDVASRPPDVK
jgi:hypothetical protein